MGSIIDGPVYGTGEDGEEDGRHGEEDGRHREDMVVGIERRVRGRSG